MSKHWLTEFWSFQSVKKVKPSIDLRHVPELFCETYSACIRILSVPKFVSVLSIWPACFSNTLSLCIFTWKVKGDYKNQIFFITQVNAALYKKHILHTFTSLLLSYKPLKGHILVFITKVLLHLCLMQICNFTFVNYVNIIGLSPPLNFKLSEGKTHVCFCHTELPALGTVSGIQ